MTATTDLQYAVGTNPDGIWGPKSRDMLWAGIRNHSGSVFAALAAYITQQHNSPSLTSLGIAFAEDHTLRLKPQNLLVNLPIGGV